jgi:hypothetical protein
MTAVFRSRLVGLVLLVTVGWLPAAPPEHVHEEQDHGHETLLVHRHFTAHSFAHHTTRDNRILDHEDAPVLTFDPVYVVPTIAPVVGPPPSTVMAMVEPPIGETLHRSREYVERLIHAPPRAPTSLRAPPAISRL